MSNIILAITIVVEILALCVFWIDDDDALENISLPIIIIGVIIIVIISAIRIWSRI